MALILFFLLFPTIGRWVIRTRVIPKVAERLGRSVKVKAIRVGYGDVTMEGISVDGLADVTRVRAGFAFWPALLGRVRLGKVVIEEPRLTLTRDANGADNWSDVVDRLRRRGGKGGGGRGRGYTPEEVTIQKGSVAFVDEQGGVRAGIERIEGTARPRAHAHVELTGASMGLNIGPRATARSIAMDVDLADPARPFDVKVTEGAASLIPTLSLTGITGEIKSTTEAGRARIDFEGGYGGAPGKLWNAQGWMDPEKRDADLHVRAERFTLDKLERILAGTAVENPERTSITAALDVAVRDGNADFTGNLSVAGLNLHDVMLADDPVEDLGFEGEIEGRYEHRARLFVLRRLGVDFRGVNASLDGFAALKGGREEGTLRPQPRVKLHLVVPPVPCQQALDAIPPALAPRLQGFKLAGTFDTEINLQVDWADLESLALGGHVGIFKCRVKEPNKEMDAARLLEEFEQFVEVEENEWISFPVGPSNPDFVPLAEVSPHVVNSLMTTEDNGFYKHHGFIVHEFRSALIKNLQEGQKRGRLIVFKFGASSITMQMVKNVLLHRQKTVSRKLQELFLTWYVETQLPKDRIMEIYLNVIEFGPGIYGIGPAARHYFGKPAKDINPVEAAFFSSILPDPKGRYMQYCEGQLTRWGDGKVQRVIKTMHERQRLTDEEYQAALATPLLFDRTEALPEKECKEMTRRMIERARPTTPGKHAKDWKEKRRREPKGRVPTPPGAPIR